MKEAVLFLNFRYHAAEGIQADMEMGVMCSGNSLEKEIALELLNP